MVYYTGTETTLCAADSDAVGLDWSGRDLYQGKAIGE